MSYAGQKRKFMGTSDDTARKNWHRGDEDTTQSHTQGRLDLTFGQRSVFPGLDDYTLTGDDTLDHDDELGALDYLKSVRQEAISIPTLLVAPKDLSNDRSIYEDGVGDSRGWYSQGAYTAAPISPGDDETVSRDPQSLFYDSLVSKYQALRVRLNQTPPDDIREKLDQSLHPTHVKKSKEGEEQWNSRLLNISPNPVQLALMNKWSVLRLLSSLTNTDAVLRRGTEINQNTSLWLWGLLAKVPDRGEMSSEEIAIVRELGKKTILIGLGFKQAEGWNDGLDAIEADRRGETGDGHDGYLEDQGANPEEDIPDPTFSWGIIDSTASPPIQTPELQSPPTTDAAGGSNSTAVLTTGAEAEELAAAKARLLGSMNKQEPVKTDTSVPSKNTRVTLDMILTVAGEVYGQRDLLEFREKWEE